jgi:aconitate hydratase
MKDSWGVKTTLTVEKKQYQYFDLSKLANVMGIELTKLPITLRILLENLARAENGRNVTQTDIRALGKWLDARKSNHEIEYFPARVLMQDFTGVPAVVDLAAMRDAASLAGKSPNVVNPLIPVDLVIDHSVQVDRYASSDAFTQNVMLEMQRNKERYEFLKWGQQAFRNFRVVPPGTGICHQVNLEYLAQVVWQREENGETLVFPDTVVGTDSHTTMINGLAVLGWGVGGIEAEAAMLGQGISMVIPEVIGMRLSGELHEGISATDLVLTITQMLRKKGVVGKFVEFFGPGLNQLPLADRATISNMAPEYGATCAFFPVDEETLRYLALSGRSEHQIELVRQYAQQQFLWRNDSESISYTDTLELDLAEVVPSMAGPRRPQDRVNLNMVAAEFDKELPQLDKDPQNIGKSFNVSGQNYQLRNGDVVIAAITSCTNTSNPYVMIGAGLVARKARALGLKTKPWVKTSLAPGSKVVSGYLENSGLQIDLDALGFNLVGYGCTTCIGNSGPLNPEIEHAVSENNLVVASVLSGNRNFEGRVHPLVRANYLASPMLCVVYALVGTILVNPSNEPIGQDHAGNNVFLKDLWPTKAEIEDILHYSVSPLMFRDKYSQVFTGDQAWQDLTTSQGETYLWDVDSTYIKRPPYFENFGKTSALSNVENARILAIFGDSITTDHISPAGSIAKNSPAARYLQARGVEVRDFNSYGARRGNHEIMMRGTFANIRIRNEINPEVEGGYTKYNGIGDIIPIFDAAELYRAEGVSTVIIAGKEYGTGSSRDWAAKGPSLQGVKVVIAESFERIHRSNLVGMGIIPAVFLEGMTRHDLSLQGTEIITVNGINNLLPRALLQCTVSYTNGSERFFEVRARIETEIEMEYIKNGGILHYVLKNL